MEMDVSPPSGEEEEEEERLYLHLEVFSILPSAS